jgi:multidrug efflux pump subunit AcrB
VVERAPVEVRRFDRNRAISVFARVDDKVITPLEANAKLVERFADISLRYPGYRLDFRGQFDEFKQAFSDLKVLLIIGLVLVYIMLTAQFKSLAQPLIILFAVPLSFMGAVLALIITGKPFSIPVMYGIVALAGIVVNDGLVLVDFINQGRRRGMNRWRSILQGCKIRLRPVLLTTVTTIAGMLPMATGIGGRSEIWMPLANTMVFGLLVASLLTLVVVPALYAMLDDIKAGLARLSGQA